MLNRNSVLSITALFSLSILSACGPSIMGEWVLIEYEDLDEDDLDDNDIEMTVVFDDREGDKLLGEMNMEWGSEEEDYDLEAETDDGILYEVEVEDFGSDFECEIERGEDEMKCEDEDNDDWVFERAEDN